MRGNPKSPNPFQKNPYATVTDKKGNVYGADGKIIVPTKQNPNPTQTPEAHIPIKDLDPSKFDF
jgi:hypothetical protein